MEAFNRTIDERRYEAAYRIALQARSEYPFEPVTEFMMNKAVGVLQIVYGEEPSFHGSGDVDLAHSAK